MNKQINVHEILISLFFYSYDKNLPSSPTALIAFLLVFIVYFMFNLFHIFIVYYIKNGFN